MKCLIVILVSCVCYFWTPSANAGESYSSSTTTNSSYEGHTEGYGSAGRTGAMKRQERQERQARRQARPWRVNRRARVANRQARRSGDYSFRSESSSSSSFNVEKAPDLPE